MNQRVSYEYPDITPEESTKRVDLAIAELDGPEGEAIRAHIRWFRRRYPTPSARLRFAARKYRE